jgi:hypothetical protein
MAVGNYKLPVCDGCRLPWLPTGWKQDSDPRQMPEGSKPLRCGKCKSPNWDREFVKKAKEEKVFDPEIGMQASDTNGSRPNVVLEALLESTTMSIAIPIKPRCVHRMTTCPICHSEPAQDA